MPIIHKLISPKIETSLAKVCYEHRLEKYKKTTNLTTYMFDCNCLHPENIHHEFNNFICPYSGQYCECKGLSPFILNFRIIITEIDLFEFEVKDHSERDSLSYFNELHLWRITRECEQ